MERGKKEEEGATEANGRGVKKYMWGRVGGE